MPEPGQRSARRRSRNGSSEGGATSEKYFLNSLPNMHIGAVARCSRKSEISDLTAGRCHSEARWAVAGQYHSVPCYSSGGGFSHVMGSPRARSFLATSMEKSTSEFSRLMYEAKEVGAWPPIGSERDLNFCS